MKTIHCSSAKSRGASFYTRIIHGPVLDVGQHIIPMGQQEEVVLTNAHLFEAMIQNDIEVSYVDLDDRKTKSHEKKISGRSHGK